MLYSFLKEYQWFAFVSAFFVMTGWEKQQQRSAHFGSVEVIIYSMAEYTPECLHASWEGCVITCLRKCRGDLGREERFCIVEGNEGSAFEVESELGSFALFFTFHRCSCMLITVHDFSQVCWLFWIKKVLTVFQTVERKHQNISSFI